MKRIWRAFPGAFILSAPFVIGCSIFGSTGSIQGTSGDDCIRAAAQRALNGGSADLDCALVPQSVGGSVVLVEQDGGTCPLAGDGSVCSNCVLTACCTEAVDCLPSSDAGGCGAFSACVRTSCSDVCEAPDGGEPNGNDDGGLP